MPACESGTQKFPLCKVSHSSYQLLSYQLLAIIYINYWTISTFMHDFIPAPSSSHCSTRASQSGKFKHKLCRTIAGYHFYLNRIIRLWNALPQIDLSLPFQSIKHFIFEFLSLLIFNPTSHVHIILCACPLFFMLISSPLV